MGTLSLSLTGVAAGYVVPAILVQTSFAQGAVMGNPGLPKVLFMGVRTSAGVATVDSQVYPLPTEAEVIRLFGTGSQPHVAWKAFTDVCKSADLQGIAVTESAGVAASGTITFTTTATAAGKVTYTFNGETIEVGFSSGDAFDTVIAEALKEAINDQTHWPITAARVAGVITVTYRTKGTDGNWARHRATITAGCGTTIAVNAATLGSGATDETYTAALATILATEYDYIVPCVNPTAGSNARISALATQVATQALATTGIRQKYIFASSDSLANATTLVTAYNGARGQCVYMKNSEWMPLQLAAHVAGVRYNLETGADPGASFDSYGAKFDDIWNVPAPYSVSDRLSKTDQNTAIAVGLSPIATDNNGNTYLVMSCTAAGADPRIRDTAKVTVVDRFADDLAARYASQWSRAKLADDPPAGAKEYPAIVLTPTRLKQLTIFPLLRSYRDSSLLVNVDGTTGSLASTATGIDPIVATRINAQIPLEVTPLAHQVQFLINEVSSG